MAKTKPNKHIFEDVQSDEQSESSKETTAPASEQRKLDRDDAVLKGIWCGDGTVIKPGQEQKLLDFGWEPGRLQSLADRGLIVGFGTTPKE